MAERLGGDIGVERDAPSVAAGYQQLRDYRDSTRGLRTVTNSDAAGSTPVDHPRAAPSQPYGRRRSNDKPFPWETSSPPLAPVRYRDRVRMDFTAARVEHQQKTLVGALASLVSPIVPVADSVSRRFIATAITDVVEHVKRLSSSVRELLGYSRRLSWRLDRTPRVFAMLTALRDWDFESLDRAVRRLQERRRVVFADVDDVARLLYRPIIQFHGKVELEEIERALELAYQERVKRLPKTSPRLPKLRLHHTDAMAEAAYVFETLKRRCYPLLMKVATREYRPLDRFFDDALGELMSFTHLSEEDRVPEQSAAEESIDEESPAAGPSTFVVNGLRLLDRLFPRAGWERVDWSQPQEGRAPDLYSYFACLLDYPPFFELIPPADPLMPAVTLVLILGELFPVLESVRFGPVPGTTLPLSPVLSELTAGWGSVGRDVIGYDYLRLVRESADLRRYGGTDSLYAKRLDAEAREIRREYLVPWAPSSSERRVVLEGRSSYPVLHENVEQLADLLLRVAVELTEASDENAAPQSVTNPWERPTVPIDNQIANRVRSVTKWNNANLVLVAAAVTAVLDHLLNEVEGAWPAELSGAPLYRSQSDGSPVESVGTIDAVTLMRLLDDPATAGVEVPGFQSRSVLPLAVSSLAAAATSLGLLVAHIDGAAELWADSEEDLALLVGRVDRLVSEGVGAAVHHRIARSVDSLIFLCEPAVDRYHAVELLTGAARGGLGLRLGIVERFAANQSGAVADWTEKLASSLVAAETGTLLRLDPDDGSLYTDREFR